MQSVVYLNICKLVTAREKGFLNLFSPLIKQFPLSTFNSLGSWFN